MPNTGFCHLAEMIHRSPQVFDWIFVSSSYACFYIPLAKKRIATVFDSTLLKGFQLLESLCDLHALKLKMQWSGKPFKQYKYVIVLL